VCIPRVGLMCWTGLATVGSNETLVIPLEVGTKRKEASVRRKEERGKGWNEKTKKRRRRRGDRRRVGQLFWVERLGLSVSAVCDKRFAARLAINKEGGPSVY